jgi:hypothetical protein
MMTEGNGEWGQVRNAGVGRRGMNNTGGMVIVA